MSFKRLRLEIDRGDDPRWASLCTTQRPFRQRWFGLTKRRQFSRLHHLSQIPVHQQDHQHTVPFRQIEREPGQVDRFLDRCRRKRQRTKIAVPG